PGFLRIEPHGHHRQQEQQRDPDVEAQRAQHLGVDVQIAAAELARVHALQHEHGQHAVEEKGADEGKERHHHPGGRGDEIRLPLLAHDREHRAHASPPEVDSAAGSAAGTAPAGSVFAPLSPVRERKISSSDSSTVRSSTSPQPASTTRRAMASRTGVAATSTCQVPMPFCSPAAPTLSTPSMRCSAGVTCAAGPRTCSCRVSVAFSRWVSFSGVSTATSAPRLMITTRSHEVEASESIWVLMMTVWFPASSRT